MIGWVERRVIPPGKRKTANLGPATVRVRLTDGQILERTVEKAKETPEGPMSALLQSVDSLDRLDELMACYRPAT